MFGNSHFARLHDMFADQFAPDGTDFLYRKGMKGAPIRVSAAERDGFVADFKRQVRYLTFGLVAATVLLIGGLVIVLPDGPERDAGKVPVILGVGLILAVWLPCFYWVWNAPARALQRRPAIGNALTGAEARRVALAQTTYGQFVVAVGAGTLFLWYGLTDDQPFDLWKILWLGFWALIVPLAIVQAFRKWRFEHSSA